MGNLLFPTGLKIEIRLQTRQTMTVRPFLRVLFLLPFLFGSAQLCCLQAQYAKKSTTFSQIVEEAEKRSGKPYQPVKPQLREEFLELDYDEYRKMHWNPKLSLWAEDDLNFRLEFFHPGYLFKTPVQMNEFTGSHIQNIPFTSEFFEYGDLDLNPRRISRRAGYAGFRLLFPLNEAGKFDEVLSFLGASYFRALGAGQRYGKSARALALNTGLPVPEEFPEFIEFWIGKPEFASTRVRVYGLMDSPSVAGAFQFDIQPGVETIIEVESVLFFRNKVEWTGLAPLTSMYWYGENHLGRPVDFRPEVHDSDGLLVQTADGWEWRPLVNDGHQRRFTLGGEGIQGFGLMQRDRGFEQYQDLEAWYHARPSVWITPRETWDVGHVELIEFPTDHEYFDNIVAAWVPETKPTPGEPYSFSYRLGWSGNSPEAPNLARVSATRVGRDPEGEPGSLFVVEFADPNALPQWEEAKLQPEVTAAAPATVREVKLLRNPFGPGWRITFRVNGDGPAELACRLLYEGRTVSENWTYPWRPN